MSFESRSTPISIDVKVRADGTIWTFQAPTGNPLVAESLVRMDDLVEQRRLLRTNLLTLTSAFANPSSSTKWRAVSNAVVELRRKGLEVAWQLFGDQWSDVQKLFETAFPLWETAEPPILEVVLMATEASAIPLEFLPVFGREKSVPTRISNLLSLSSYLKQFLGFSTFVSRVLPGARVERCLTLDDTQRLPVKFFQHAGLEWAITEAEFFHANKSLVDMDGPWPNKKLPHNEVVKTLAKHLRNPSRTFEGSERSIPDQVQHFACHCDTHRSVSTDHSLKLAHSSQVEYEVTIGQLQAEFASLSGDPFYGPKPLVFLNACGSSATLARAVTSFARLFLYENKNRGFIGVETDINDRAAATFSREFYSFFLQGLTLGEAIYLSRWKLLNYYKDPSAFLFVVFADARIRLGSS